MEVKATTRYTRISPFKLRLPIDEVKGKTIVAVDHGHFRSTEVETLPGDPAKAKQ